MRLAILLLCGLIPSLLWAEVGEIRILALLPGKAMLNIDGSSRVLAVGEESRDGVRLLSVDTEHAVLLYDGEQHVLNRRSHRNTQHIHLQSAPPQASVQRDASGMFLATGSINGVAMRMIVDTGANLLALSRRHADRLQLQNIDSGREMRVNTASGAVRGHAVTLQRVQLGAIEMYNVNAVVLEGNYPQDVLLGMSFLKHLNIQHDGNLMHLQQSH